MIKKVMKLLLALILAAGLLSAFSAEAAPAAAEQFQKEQKEEYAEGEILVQLKNYDANARSNNYFGESISGITIEGTFIFTSTQTAEAASRAATSDDVVIMQISSDQYSTEQLVEKFESMSNVEYAEPNYRCYITTATNDSYSKYQWGLQNEGQNGGTAGADINVGKIWNDGVTGTEKVIAVIDTGVDYSHEDLKANMWSNPYSKNLPGKYGYNFVSDTTAPMDDNGHGSHCAGIIAAQGNNGVGISGVNQSAKIMALKFLDEDGEGYLDDAIDAYYYINKAQNLGVDVVAINNSWGGGGSSNIFKEVIEMVGKNGAVSVCAAGNDAEDTDEYPSMPGCIDSPYVINVAAATEDGELATFSNYGKESVDLAAPGTNILSSVSTPVFNPSLYDSALLDKTCLYYSNFSGTNTFLEGEQISGGRGTATAAASSDEFFGVEADSGESLSWNITGAKKGDTYCLYFPYEASASNNDIYVSAMTKFTQVPYGNDPWYYSGVLVMGDYALDEDGTIPEEIIENLDDYIDFNVTDYSTNYWEHLQGTVNHSNDDEKRALVFILLAYKAGDYTISIDDMAISKADADPADFGKYDFYNGTSMAAPAVTGSVALVSEAKALKKAGILSEALKDMTKSYPGLTDKTASGGMLDLTDYQIDKPYIEKIKINSDKSVSLTGSNFGTEGGTVKANGEVIPADKLTWKDTEIRITKGGLVNRKVVFEVTNDFGTGKKSVYLVEGKSSFKETWDAEEVFDGGMLTTDGKKAYYVDTECTIYCYEDAGTKYADWDMIGMMEAKKVFPKASEDELENGTVYFDSEVVYLNGYFYGVAVLDSRYSKEYALARLDAKKMLWKKYADLPTDNSFKNVVNSTLAVYDGKLYLLGGIDAVTQKVSSAVRYYNTSSKAWKKGASMPEGRFKAVGRQVGSSLVMVLGGSPESSDLNGKEPAVPKTLVMKGSTWTTGSAPGNYIGDVLSYVELMDPQKDGQTYKNYYYEGSVGIVSGGVIISGFPVDGMGDTMTYNMKTAKFKASDYQLFNETGGYKATGIAIGSKFYVMTGWADEERDEYDNYFITGMTWDEYTDTKVSVISVTSGLSQIVTSNVKNGKVTGTGKYLPGQKVKITCKPNKGYYLTSWKAAGSTIKKASGNVITGDKITVTTTFTKYKTKVKLNKTSLTLKAKDTYKLKATVTGAYKGVKKVKWTTSNKKYATVDSKGNVKIKKAGAGKKVTIYATATDGSKVKTKCVIKIKK